MRDPRRRGKWNKERCYIEKVLKFEKGKKDEEGQKERRMRKERRKEV